jgi:hypothetical protein
MAAGRAQPLGPHSTTCAWLNCRNAALCNRQHPVHLSECVAGCRRTGAFWAASTIGSTSKGSHCQCAEHLCRPTTGSSWVYKLQNRAQLGGPVLGVAVTQARTPATQVSANRLRAAASPTQLGLIPVTQHPGQPLDLPISKTHQADWPGHTHPGCAFRQQHSLQLEPASMQALITRPRC